MDITLQVTFYHGKHKITIVKGQSVPTPFFQHCQGFFSMQENVTSLYEGGDYPELEHTTYKHIVKMLKQDHINVIPAYFEYENQNIKLFSSRGKNKRALYGLLLCDENPYPYPYGDNTTEDFLTDWQHILNRETYQLETVKAYGSETPEIYDDILGIDELKRILKKYFNFDMPINLETVLLGFKVPDVLFN